MAGYNALKITALHIPGGTQESNTAFFLANKISIQMNVQPSWNSEAAYGKMDAIPFYSNTQRSFTYDFTCISDDADFNPTYLTQQVDKLQKFQYPRYTGKGSAATITAAPFFNIQFYIQGGGKKYSLYEEIDGYFDQGVQIIPGHAGAAEELTPPVRGVTGGSAAAETAFKINFNFVVLHRNLPGWNGGSWSGDGFWSVSGANTKSPTAPAVPANPDDTKSEATIKK